MPDERNDADAVAESDVADRRGLMQRLLRLVRLAVKVFLSIVLLYAAVLLIGLIPINNDFQPAADGVEIIVVSSSVHADIIVPIKHAVKDWRTEFRSEMFLGDTSRATHVGFGWGDRGFYVNTPTWDDLKLSTAANALIIPSECCMHVQCFRILNPPASARRVRLTDEQYERLVAYIRGSFKVGADGASIVQIPAAHYGRDDAFFTATGNYHALYTCNSWVGQALRTSGVRAPLMTPLPGSPMLYLPESNQEGEAPAGP